MLTAMPCGVWCAVKSLHHVCLVALSFFPPAVWATRGPVIALRDKRV